MKKFIKFHRYWFTDKEKKELLDTLDSGWITTGPKTERFEQDFAGYVKAGYAVGVTSGTAALHLSLLALGIGKGDEVITTPLTFVSTLNSILYVGARPVLADVEPDTLNIDPEQIRKKITSRTRAIIPVHYAGQPCRMDEITAIAKKNNLFVIEDAAHAIESEASGRKVGSIGDMACFSFHVIKNITTGEGGMVTTNNKRLADKVRVSRLHGLDKGAWKRYAAGKLKHYDMSVLGQKYNMTDIQASLGLQQLKKIDLFWARRKKLSELYDSLLGAEEDITVLPGPRAGDKNSYHLYPIRVRTGNLRIDRDGIMSAMMEKGVGVSFHFQCAHLFDFYRRYFSYRPGAFPVSEDASRRLISLPLYPRISEDEITYIAGTLKRVIGKARKNKGAKR